MALVSTKLRDSARGQPCTFRIPGVCNGDPATTVLAHIRDENKGMGNKADDYSGAFACSSCHDHYDQRRLPQTLADSYALKAMQRTHKIWVEMGLMVFPEKAARAQTSSKIMARRHIATGEVIS